MHNIKQHEIVIGILFFIAGLFAGILISIIRDIKQQNKILRQLKEFEENK